MGGRYDHPDVATMPLTCHRDLCAELDRLRMSTTIQYSTIGIMLPHRKDWVSIVTAPGVRAWLVSPSHIERVAPELLLAKDISAALTAGTTEGAFNTLVKASVQARTPAARSPRPALVVQVEWSSEWTDMEVEYIAEDFSVSLRGPRKEEIRDNTGRALRSVLGALAVAAPAIVKVEPLEEVTMAHPPTGRHIYTFAAIHHVDAFITPQWGTRMGIACQATFDRLLDEQWCHDAINYLHRAQANDTDPVRAFLFGFLGLELMIKRLFVATGGRLTVTANGRPDRGATLSNKFRYLSGFLPNSEREASAQTFEEIRKLRNAFFHGDSVDLELLPRNAPAALGFALLGAYLTTGSDPLNQMEQRDGV